MRFEEQDCTVEEQPIIPNIIRLFEAKQIELQSKDLACSLIYSYQQIIKKENPFCHLFELDLQ